MKCGCMLRGECSDDFTLSRVTFCLATVLSMDTPPTKSTSADAIDEIALLLVEMAEESDTSR
jgi:hypothetical protein